MARSRAARVRRLAAGRGVAGRGLTVLEIMIVLAIIGLLAYLGYSGFRTLSSRRWSRTRTTWRR
jgi:prepilin-type N-terminal cleavage/methylation domain-containing protein